MMSSLLWAEAAFFGSTCISEDHHAAMQCHYEDNENRSLIGVTVAFYKIILEYFFMKKIILFFIFAVAMILILLVSRATQQQEINTADVTVSMKIVPASFAYQFGYEHNDSELINNTKQVVISWELSSKMRAQNQYRLYYAPYIIIIPPNNEWGYFDYPQINERSYVRSFSGELMDVLKNYPEYNWNKIGEFGFYFHAIAFDQGSISIAFKKRVSSSYEDQVFKAYFIYFNPITKQGWAKTISAKVK